MVEFAGHVVTVAEGESGRTRRLSECVELCTSETRQLLEAQKKASRHKTNQILTVDFDLVSHSMWIHKTMPTVVSSKHGKGVGVKLKEEGLLPSVGWVKWLPRAGHVVPGPSSCDGANRNSCVSVTDPHRLDLQRILEVGDSAFSFQI